MIEVREVPLNDDGYDAQGTYWGVGLRLYHWSTSDGFREGHVRASSVAEAMLMAEALLGAEIFYVVWTDTESEQNYVTEIKLSRSELFHLSDLDLLAKCWDIEMSDEDPEWREGNPFTREDNPQFPTIHEIVGGQPVFWLNRRT